MAAVSARLKGHGLKRSGVRDAVVEEFFRAGTHVSIDDLLDRVRERIPATGYSTVYRTMRLLVDHGFATTRDFGGAHTLFEPADTRHHDHIVCTQCGATLGKRTVTGPAVAPAARAAPRGARRLLR